MRPSSSSPMPSRKHPSRLAAFSAILAAVFVGAVLHHTPPTHAQQQQAPQQGEQQQQQSQPRQEVQTTPQQMATVHDLSAAFRNVGRVVKPSVVSIRVTKAARGGVHRGLPDDLLRRFFPDRDGDGEPDLPEDMIPPDDGGENGEGDESPQRSPRMPEDVGTGSGVVVEVTNGTAYIVTNNHVASEATEMQITLHDGRTIREAQVVGTDPKTDLAVIKIQGDRLTAAKWGDSAQLQPGDWILAFGSPFGYVGSMTHGIVSAMDRQAGILGQYGYENFIQVDAPINPGNSGGPLVNLRGEVVGISTAIATRSGGFQGIGFAIPSNQAKQIYQILKDKGKVVRGWLGVEIGDLATYAEEARATGYEGETGALVKGVLRDTPASGKLEAGDVITALNGQPIENTQDFRNSIAMVPPGTQVRLQVVREGKPQEVAITLGEQPGGPPAVAARNARRPAPEEQATAALGMQLASVPEAAARRYNLAAGAGALVTRVDPDSLAAEAGVERGDVIVRINNQPVTSATEAGQFLAKADLAKGLRLLLVNRDGSKFVFLRK